GLWGCPLPMRSRFRIRWNLHLLSCRSLLRFQEFRMATSNNALRAEPIPSGNDQIQFKARHRPKLPAGEYTVSVTHTIPLAGVPATDTTFDSDQVEFAVLGPRFSLHDSDVDS